VRARFLVAGLVIVLVVAAGAITTASHGAANPPIYDVSTVLAGLRSNPRAWAGRTVRVRGTVWFDQYLHGPFAPPHGWALPHGLGIVSAFPWGGRPVPQPPSITWLNRDYIAHAAITSGFAGLFPVEAYERGLVLRVLEEEPSPFQRLTYWAGWARPSTPVVPEVAQNVVYLVRLGANRTSGDMLLPAP